MKINEQIGDQKVVLYLHQPGAPTFARTASFTSLATHLVSVDANNQTTLAREIEPSHPSPVLSFSQCALSNVRPSTNYQNILGTLNLAGALSSAVADLHPGTNGAIDEVRV